MNTKARLASLDIAKCFASFLVVAIHADFPGLFGKYVNAFARIAVPLFFLISGYYYPIVDAQGKTWRQGRKLLVYTLVSSTVFMLLELVSAIAGGRLAESMSLWFSQKSILKFLFFNVFPFAGHLWYLYALLYSYLIFEIFKSLKINKKHKDYFNSLIHDKLHIKFFSRLLSLPEFPLHWHSLPLDGLSYQGNRGLANVQKGFRIPRTVPVPFLPFRSGNRGIPFPPA